jgi:hypothetical protein
MIRNPKLVRLAFLLAALGSIAAAVGGYFEPLGCSW